MGAVRRVCLGVITGAHGVRGEVKVRPFTEAPEAIAAYGPVSDDAGRRELRLRVVRVTPNGVVVRIAGCDDRDAAAALRGTELWVDRDRLPEPAADEWYTDDLKGLAVVDEAGGEIGRVRAVVDHGSGDVVEIVTGDGKELVLPFTRAQFPEVDIARGRMVAAPSVFLEAGAAS